MSSAPPEKLEREGVSSYPIGMNDYPLHSVEIRHSSHAFSWLKRGADEYEKFMRDLSRFLTTIDLVGLACVVDRPGYDARYREKYGRRQWHLCQTAFSVVVERAAKYARDSGRKLRVIRDGAAATMSDASMATSDV
jgi:hypothetical protein